MNEKVERLARALWMARQTRLEVSDLVLKFGAKALSWDEADDVWRNTCRDDVHTVLSVLREEDPDLRAMIDAVL